MTKAFKIFLISVTLFLSAYGSAHAVVFSGLEGEGDVPYGVCLDDPENNPDYCDGVNCDDAEMKTYPGCISQTEVGTGLFKESVKGAGITHTDNLGDLIIKYVNFILPYLTLAAFVGFVVAGFLYVTAYGAEEQLKKAKQILIWSVVGLILVIASFTIVQFLTSGLLEQLQ
jgi:hypothetical protein